MHKRVGRPTFTTEGPVTLRGGGCRQTQPRFKDGYDYDQEPEVEE